MNFKNQYSDIYRLAESERVRRKYPDRVPIICERMDGSHIEDIDKKKYLVPGDLTMGQFIFVIRKRLKLNSEKAIFLFTNNKIMPTISLLIDIYNNNKDKDGFLYFKYSEENVFG